MYLARQLEYIHARMTWIYIHVLLDASPQGSCSSVPNSILVLIPSNFVYMTHVCGTVTVNNQLSKQYIMSERELKCMVLLFLLTLNGKCNSSSVGMPYAHVEKAVFPCCSVFPALC